MSHLQKQPLCILQVNTFDIGGGAEKIARDLFQAYKTKGHTSWLAVSFKYSNEPEIFLIPSFHAYFYSKCFALANILPGIAKKIQKNEHMVRMLFHFIRHIQSVLDWRKGIEDFNFPETWRLFDILPKRPDILHCHNLHGNYFDLRTLPYYSHQVPTILTLHDAWLLGGHCAHSFDCERWKTGCGDCPNITMYSAIRRDSTAYNWQIKKNIYAKSRLYVATPSRWLMQKVEQSMLAPGIVEARVIPNGINLSIFRPDDKGAVRKRLGIAQDSKVLIFTANGIRKNIWKDYQTLKAAITSVAEQLHKQNLLFIALGEDAPSEKIGQAEIRFIPYQKSPQMVAQYYQLADMYIHASRVDTFPNTVLEALACGTPVVATAVGGIPEQINGAEIANCELRDVNLNTYGLDKSTGILVPPGDAEEMARAIIILLKDETLLRQLGENAANDARQRFDLNLQVQAYLTWYEQIIATWVSN